MSILGHYILAHALIAISTVVIGLFVFLRGPDKPLNRIFLFYNACMAWWGGTNLLMVLAPNAEAGLLADRISLMGIVFLPTAFLHFTLAFIGRIKKHIKLIYFSYGMSVLFAIANWTPLMAKSVSRKHFVPFFTDPGNLYPFFLTFFASIMTLSLVFSWNAYREAKTQSKKVTNFYFLLAAFLATAGGSGNFFAPYDIFLPFIIPYGSYGVVIYALITGYLIVKRRFLDIELIIKKTLIFSGIFVMFMAVVSVVTAISQSFVGQYLKMGIMTNGLMCSLFVALLYNPTHKLLINITDQYLFQRRGNFKIILNRLAKNIISILDLHEVGETVLNTLQESLRLETGTLILRDEKNKHYGLLTAFNLNQVGRKFPSDSEFIRYFSGPDKSINLEEPDTAHMLPNEVVKNLETLKAVICVPLFAHGELIGLLTMGKKRSDQEFTQEEIDYLPTVASQTAIALRNAQLVDDVVQEREAKIRAQAIAKFVNYSKSIRHEIKNVVSKIYLPAEYLKVLNEFFDKLIKKIEEGFADKKKAEIVKKMIMEKKEPLIRYRNTLILAGDQITLAANTASSAFSDDPNKFSIIYFRILWDAAKEEANLEDCDCGANYADDYSVFGNLYLLQRVFVNLLNNSKDAMKGQKNMRIVVNCSTQTLKGGQEVSWFEFQDNGPGISPEIADKIFEQDFSTKPKPDDADPQSSGYGQGLYVCKTTIEDQHLGKIWVDREAKGGAKFIFWLPKKKSKE